MCINFANDIEEYDSVMEALNAVPDCALKICVPCHAEILPLALCSVNFYFIYVSIKTMLEAGRWLDQVLVTRLNFLVDSLRHSGT